MHAVLSTKDSLLDLRKAAEGMIQSAHRECDVGCEGDATLVATTLPDVEASQSMRPNKPLLTKACKASVGGLGKVRVEKLSMESGKIAPQKQP